jgi:hypothetical protein
MKSVIIATALGVALFAAPALAQDRNGTMPSTTPGSAPSTPGGTSDHGVGAGGIGDPGARVRSETERSRSFDRQRDASPMTSDPRLGPGSSPGSGSSSGSGNGSGSGR